MGRYDEAFAELKRAQELDPLSLIINVVLGEVYRVRRENDQAIEQAKKTVEMDPNFGRAHLFPGGSISTEGHVPRSCRRIW